MKDMFLTVLNMSLSASVVILAVLAARLVLRQAPKKWSYLLWAVVGFRLCCPVSLESVLSIFRAAPVKPTVSQVAPVGQAPASAIQYIPRTVTALPVAPVTNTGTVPSVPAVSPAVTAPAAPGAVTAQVWLVAAIALWVVGMAALLLYAVVSYLELKGSLTTATRLEGSVYEADGIRSPFILGLFRPKIYIPYGLDPSTLGYVLDHERYHIRRGDHIWKTLAYILLAVHWFNPLVWLSFHLMGKDMEMSCDEKVLGRGGNIRREYSTTLLSFATERRFPAAAPLAFGETAVKTRIKNALNWKRPKTWATLLSALLCIALVVSCAVNPTVESPADPPEASGAPVVTDSPSPSPVAESPVPVMMQVTIPVDWVAGLVEEESYVNRVSLYERQSREEFRADYPNGFDGQSADSAGMGWLCTIVRVDADEAREIREMDSGGAVFAEDGRGAYYAFYYPTDVRLYRAGGDISGDAGLWNELNEWARTVPGLFLAQHPELTAITDEEARQALYVPSPYEGLEGMDPLNTALAQLADENGAKDFRGNIALGIVDGSDLHYTAYDSATAWHGAGYAYGIVNLFAYTDAPGTAYPGGDHVHLTFADGKTMDFFADAPDLIQYDKTFYRARPVTEDIFAPDPYTLARGWFDECEYQDLSLFADMTAISHREYGTYLEGAQAWSEMYEGYHLQVSSGSKYKWTYMKCIAEDAPEATQLARQRGEADEFTWAFGLTTVFVPENEGAKNWSMAGNTVAYADYLADGGTAIDGVPEGAYIRWSCGYVTEGSDPKGWYGRIVGTSW